MPSANAVRPPRQPRVSDFTKPPWRTTYALGMLAAAEGEPEMPIGNDAHRMAFVAHVAGVSSRAHADAFKAGHRRYVRDMQARRGE